MSTDMLVSPPTKPPSHSAQLPPTPPSSPSPSPSSSAAAADVGLGVGAEVGEGGGADIAYLVFARGQEQGAGTGEGTETGAGAVGAGAETEAAGAEGAEGAGGVTVTGNCLVDALGPLFFLGRVRREQVRSTVMLIEAALEDAAGSDTQLRAALCHKKYALVAFLLAVIDDSIGDTGDGAGAEAEEKNTGAGEGRDGMDGMGGREDSREGREGRESSREGKEGGSGGWGREGGHRGVAVGSSADVACRCLAFAGDIAPHLWVAFAEQGLGGGAAVLLGARAAVQRVKELLLLLPPKAPPNLSGAYLGYDSRDVADYNMQGYEEGGGEDGYGDSGDRDSTHTGDSVGSQSREERAAKVHEAVMVWLLLLTQLLSHPIPMLRQRVAAARARGDGGAGGKRYSSRRLQKLYGTEAEAGAGGTGGLEGTGTGAGGVATGGAGAGTGTGTAGVATGGAGAATGGAGAATGGAGVGAVAVTLDTMDLLPFLTLLCADLLALLCGGLLTEDAHCHCMKTVALLNLQVPRLPSLDSNEIALLFAQTDRAGGGAGANLTQGLLYLLNDNGYPHIRNCETAAVIRLCKDLLHAEGGKGGKGGKGGREGGEGGEGDSGMVYRGDSSGDRDTDEPSSPSPLFRGHFYTNDVKVLVDVITRELANIPPQEIDSNNTKTGTSSSGVSSNSTSTTNTSTGAGGGVGYGGEGEALFPHTRLLYLQLLEGVVSRSSWCGAGECYRAAEISLLLGEVVGRQEGGAAYAADLLAKYEYYLQ